MVFKINVTLRNYCRKLEKRIFLQGNSTEIPTLPRSLQPSIDLEL